jgi:cellulose synthase/poly-beta-1,6-N-acetylglucosamine synthase-like glycosyltransferase
MNSLALIRGTYGTILDIAVLAVGAFFAICGLYLLALSIAALFYKEDQRASGAFISPSRRIAVLVPAHNEADYIARCVRALQVQTYPRDLYEVVVIADNCADDTARIAGAAGARVLVRNEPDRRGKGFALRWAMDQLVAAEGAPDAIAVVDADAVADPAFLDRLVKPLERGAEVVQGESLLSGQGSRRAALQATAFLLVNRTRPSGQAVLHLPCNLAGNGMLLSSRLLRAHPWDAFTSAEDLEYTIELRLLGVRPAFARGAILYSPAER